MAHATGRQRAAAAASAAAAAVVGETTEARHRSEPVRVRGGGYEEGQQGRAGAVVMPAATPAHAGMGVRGTAGREGEGLAAGASRTQMFREAEQDVQARVAVEAEVPADEMEGTARWEVEGYHGHVGGARAGLAAGIATGPERIPDMVATIPCDAHEENRKKRKSNDLRQQQFYEGEIIQDTGDTCD